jgi:hypothetical protein
MHLLASSSCARVRWVAISTSHPPSALSLPSTFASHTTYSLCPGQPSQNYEGRWSGSERPSIQRFYGRPPWAPNGWWQPKFCAQQRDPGVCIRRAAVNGFSLCSEKGADDDRYGCPFLNLAVHLLWDCTIIVLIKLGYSFWIGPANSC